MRISDWSSDVCSSDLLYLFGMWGTGVAPAVTFCQHGCTSDQAGRGFGHSIGKSGSGRRLLRWLRRLFVRLTGCQDRKSTRLTTVNNAHLVCRIMLEKKKNTSGKTQSTDTLSHNHISN